MELMDYSVVKLIRALNCCEPSRFGRIPVTEIGLELKKKSSGNGTSSEALSTTKVVRSLRVKDFIPYKINYSDLPYTYLSLII